MRTALLLIVGLLVLTGCCGKSAPTAGKPSQPIVTPSATPTTPASTTASTVTSHPPTLGSVQAVTAAVAFLAGNGYIDRTDNAGISWQREFSNGEDISHLDMLSSHLGWAVDGGLLHTSDGLHWAPVRTNQPDIDDIHFVSATVGTGLVFATDGIDGVTESEQEAVAETIPSHGVPNRTTDGGHTWTAIPSPAPLLALTANSPTSLWAADGADVWHSSDTGAHWERVLGPIDSSFADNFTNGSGYALVTMQAAGPDSAWVLFDAGQGAAGTRPWALFHVGGSRSTTCVAGNDAPSTSCPAGSEGGDYPPEISALSATSIVTVENCFACSSAAPAEILRLDEPSQPLGFPPVRGPMDASFSSPTTGYLVAAQSLISNDADYPEVLLSTQSAGATWRTQSSATLTP